MVKVNSCYHADFNCSVAENCSLKTESAAGPGSRGSLHQPWPVGETQVWWDLCLELGSAEVTVCPAFTSVALTEIWSEMMWLQ